MNFQFKAKLAWQHLALAFYPMTTLYACIAGMEKYDISQKAIDNYHSVVYSKSDSNGEEDVEADGEDIDDVYEEEDEKTFKKGRGRV